MARFAAVVLLVAAAAALLAAGRLAHAAPSAAEVFWRAVLPGSAVPDAVLRLLRPDNDDMVSETDPDGAGRPDLDYQNYSRSSAAATPAGDRVTPPHYGHDHHQAPRERHAATRTTVFFREEAVRVGERLPFRFPAAAPAALGLLPRRAAEALPLSSAALPRALALLGVAPGSARAARMAETLRACEAPPLAGEGTRFCAASLEELVERAVGALGTRDVRAVTSDLPRAGAPAQVYTVRAVRRVDGASFVGCHDEPYPYTVYLCHGTGPVRAYMMEMEGARGGAVTLATVCHTDTSRWNPDHVSFKLLGTKPGCAPICHLMPYGHIIWAKNVNRSSA